eukprot:3204333-Amphidinium_carterae.1
MMKLDSVQGAFVVTSWGWKELANRQFFEQQMALIHLWSSNPLRVISLQTGASSIGRNGCP